MGRARMTGRSRRTSAVAALALRGRGRGRPGRPRARRQGRRGAGLARDRARPGRPSDRPPSTSSISANGQRVAFAARTRTTSRPRTSTRRPQRLRARPGRRTTTILVSRATGAAGAGGRRHLQRPLDLGRRALRRLRVGRGQPLGRRRQRGHEHLRARPGRRHDDPGQPRARARGAPAANAASVQPGHLRRRALRRLPVGRRQPLGRRQQRRREHLRARPGRRHDDAGQPGTGAGRRRGERRLVQPHDLGRRQPRRLPVRRRQPLRPRTTTPSRTSSCATSPPHERRSSAARPAAAGAPGQRRLRHRRHLPVGPLRGLPVGGRQPVGRGRQRRRATSSCATSTSSTTALVSRATGPGAPGADATSFNGPSSRTTPGSPSTPSRTTSRRDDNDAVANVFVRDAWPSTTDAREPGAGPAGAAANDQTPTHPRPRPTGATSPSSRARPTSSPGPSPGAGQHLPPRRAGRRPGRHPGLQGRCRCPPSPADDEDGHVHAHACSQLRINQRISQAAIRRLNAVEARLNGGLAARDLCGYSVGPAQLGPGITSAPAAASLAPAAPADPAPIVDPGRTGQGDPLTPQRPAAADQPAHRPGRHPPGDRHHQPPRRRADRRRRAAPARSPRASSSTGSRSSPRSRRPSRPPARP